MASYGVLWEAAVMGFGGYYPNPEKVVLKPNLPRQWRNLSFSLVWQDCRFKVSITENELKLSADSNNHKGIPVQVGEHNSKDCQPGREYLFSI